MTLPKYDGDGVKDVYVSDEVSALGSHNNAKTTQNDIYTAQVPPR